MARDTWYRLDNIGKFYSSQAGSTAQTVFRFSATLTDEVDAEILQRAVNETIAAFPSFNVCLRSGMFWHYLEQATEMPAVTPENLPICFGLHVDTKSVLFRVSYYHKRINFELSHMVSDGRGATSFFRTLLTYYLQERHSIKGVSLEQDGSDTHNAENSFDRYYERGRKSSPEATHDKAPATHKRAKIYRLTGWHDEADPTYLEYHLPTSSVRELARSYKVSVTSLIITYIMLSIRADMPRRDRRKRIRISIPVDLRQIFGSTTTKNFFGLTFVSCVLEDDISVEELALRVHEKLKEATQAEHLKPRMNRMIALEKSPFLRYSPLFMKDMAIELANSITRRKITTTVSNLGQISLDEQLSPYVCDINILTSTPGLNFTICSCGNDLSIGISSIFVSQSLIKHFCRYFSAEGIEGYININRTSEEIATKWRQAKREAAIRRSGGQAPESSDRPISLSNQQKLRSRL